MIVAGREVGRKLDPIPCVECQTVFVPALPNYICCSYECSRARDRNRGIAKHRAKNLQKKTHICEVCGIEFQSWKTVGKFCSVRCKNNKNNPNRNHNAARAKRRAKHTEMVKANAAECDARRAVREALRNDAELAAESAAATKAAKANQGNSVKSCLDRRGLECRKFFGKKCFDVRHLKQCGKTL